jgi:phosphoribosylamine--glycine ligase
MKILVVGGGGREHALCWSLGRSAGVREVVCAPGNAGIAQVARVVDVGAEDLDGQLALARKERPDLIVVGPEAPLCAGLADRLRAEGFAVFGCSARAAEIEGSKAFAKDFMRRHGAPTAAYGVFENEEAVARFCLEIAAEGERRLVVKADGLAAGKGVTLCADSGEALAEARRMLGGAFGAAGRRVVIEEFLVGREASLMALVDGEAVAPLAPAEDHKQVGEGDTGPMTGGMGVVSPTPVLDEALTRRAVDEVLVPAARGLAADGRRFSGLLYAGLMLTADGPRVLEFNCRFGDPETQAVLARLDEDLAGLLLAVAQGRPPAVVRFSPRASVCVVVCAEGYPGSYRKGDPIRGLERAAAVEDTVVFHAGTRRVGDEIVTAGGRVLGVTASGADLAEARRRAYQAVGEIHFAGMHYRRDLGLRP